MTNSTCVYFVLYGSTERIIGWFLDGHSCPLRLGVRIGRVPLSRKHSWRVKARRSIIGVCVSGKFGGGSSEASKKRCSRPGFESPCGAIVCSRSEVEGGEGSLAKRAVCARVETHIVTSPRSLDPILSYSKWSRPYLANVTTLRY